MVGTLGLAPGALAPAAAGPDPAATASATTRPPAWRAEARTLLRSPRRGRVAVFDGRGTSLRADPEGIADPAQRDRLCYHTRRRDGIGDTTGVDVAVVDLSYFCELGTWQLKLATANGLAFDRATEVLVEFDIDRNPYNGCRGSEYALIGIVGERAMVIALDRSCEMPYWASLADVARVGSSTIEITFTHDSIGGPASFAWVAGLGGYGSDRDSAPFDVVPNAGRFLAHDYRLDTTSGSYGSTYLRRGPSLDLSADHEVFLVGDWNGDHHDDLLLYGFGARPERVWLARTSQRGFRLGTSPDLRSNAWPYVGDFNGDGRDDLLLRNPSGTSSLMITDSSGRFRRGPDVSVPSRYRLTTTGDFNGDGRTDLFVYNPEGGREAWFFAHRDRLGLTAGPAISIPGSWSAISGDFDGNGRDDLLLRIQGSPDRVYHSRSDRLGFTRGPAAPIDDFAQTVTGDFDADGDDDVVAYGRGMLRDRLLLSRPGVGFAGKDVRFNGVHSAAGAGNFDGEAGCDLVLWGVGALPDQAWYATG